MTKPKRVDVDAAASLLGVAPATVRKYARERRTPRASSGPLFPEMDGDGLFLVSALKAWNKDRIGRGGPGVRKNREGTECDRCGNVVERRKKDPATGQFLCKSCDLKAGEAELAG